MTRRRRAPAAALLTLALSLTGCGGTDTTFSAIAPGASIVRDLASYDAFVLASAQNNPMFADVYAIRFTPFSIDRITTDKRASSIGADEKYVVVAAADEQIDKLAIVTSSGALKPIPGLGRPSAYTPTLRNGVMYYDDAQGDEARGENRFFTWDLSTRTKKLLFRTNEELGGAAPAGGGRLLLGKANEDRNDEVILRSRSGKLTRFPVGTGVGHTQIGRGLIAVTLIGPDEKHEALLLLDPKTGKSRRLPGLELLCWNPSGTRLLARRTGDTTESRLVLLDPARPDAPTEVTTVPGLSIFGGVWVRGDLAP